MIPAMVSTFPVGKGYFPAFKGYFLTMLCTLNWEILVAYVSLGFLGALVYY